MNSSNPPLSQRLRKWKILEEDLEERFVLGSGKGGQKINKTSSCVYLKHLPTGIEVSCQDTRSREKNREIARSRLCDAFEKRAQSTQREAARQRALRRYRKKRPSAASRAKRRQDKQFRSDKKHNRRRIDP
ncbi:MAG: peptide chain release factor-like protein [Verrucomicrobiota bacterium]